MYFISQPFSFRKPSNRDDLRPLISNDARRPAVRWENPQKSSWPPSSRSSIFLSLRPHLRQSASSGIRRTRMLHCPPFSSHTSFSLSLMVSENLYTYFPGPLPRGLRGARKFKNRCSFFFLFSKLQSPMALLLLIRQMAKDNRSGQMQMDIEIQQTCFYTRVSTRAIVTF